MKFYFFGIVTFDTFSLLIFIIIGHHETVQVDVSQLMMYLLGAKPSVSSISPQIAPDYFDLLKYQVGT